MTAQTARTTLAKKYEDVIELAVDNHGKMKTTRTTPIQKDEASSDSVNSFSNFFADVNSVFNCLKSITYVGNGFKGTEIRELDGFIFPGGKTFAFKNFHFSDSQDLLCGITYADPS